MDFETVTKFKALFEEQKKALLDNRELIDEELTLRRDDMLDEADMTSSELESSMRMRLRNRQSLFLKKIDEALRRIEDGEFGNCQECGDEIEMRRLDARPTATLCMGCKEHEERLEQIHIDGHRPKSLGTKWVAIS